MTTTPRKPPRTHTTGEMAAAMRSAFVAGFEMGQEEMRGEIEMESFALGLSTRVAGELSRENERRVDALLSALFGSVGEHRDGDD